jgi:hypothetical protein
LLSLHQRKRHPKRKRKPRDNAALQWGNLELSVKLRGLSNSKVKPINVRRRNTITVAGQIGHPRAERPLLVLRYPLRRVLPVPKENLKTEEASAIRSFTNNEFRNCANSEDDGVATHSSSRLFEKNSSTTLGVRLV